MSKPKLVYFDIDSARGEAARLAMVIGGVPFEDDRVKLADWESLKPGTPFGALPVHHDRVKEHPAVKAYYTERRVEI
jgi:hypothetical protein